jgi:hypothetical protein
VARKQKPADNSYVMFDVLYQDGTRTSNRKVQSAELDPYDRDNSIRALIETQDRKIGEMSGNPRGPIKTITRSAAS